MNSIRPSTSIRNVVFDIGNVLVRWYPRGIVEAVFPNHLEPEKLAKQIFKSPIWLDLNRGKFSEKEAIQKYHHELQLDIPILEQLLEEAKKSLILIPESVTILKMLSQKGFSIYCISDNVKEIVTHLKRRYDFWQYFQGVVISADIGHLKPSKEIYQHLLSTYSLRPEESLFIDDILANVEGAQRVGMEAIQFFDPEQCRIELQKYHIHV